MQEPPQIGPSQSGSGDVVFKKKGGSVNPKGEKWEAKINAIKSNYYVDQRNGGFPLIPVSTRKYTFALKRFPEKQE